MKRTLRVRLPDVRAPSRRRRSFRLFSLVAAVWLMSPALAADVSIVEIGAVFQPEFNGALGRLVTGNQHDLVFGETVYLDETVTTGANSSTALLFLDETRLQIGANSTVVLDRFVYDPEAGKGEAIINFGQGIFRYISGSMPKEQVTLRTPTTVMAVRGTTLIVYVGPDNSTQVAVISGEVGLSPCGGASVNAAEGFSASVSADCLTAEVVPGVITPIDPAVIADLDLASLAPAAGAPPAADDDSRGEGGGGGLAGSPSGGGGGPAGGDPGGGDPGGGGGPGGGDPGGGDPGGGDPGGGSPGGGPGNGNGNLGNPGNGGGNTGGSGPGTGNGGPGQGNGGTPPGRGGNGNGGENGNGGGRNG
jgi:hypothetical protein